MDAQTTVDHIQATSDMCTHAFNALLTRLKPQTIASQPNGISIPSGRGGVFVTWSITPATTSSLSASATYSLRGCIGTLKPSAQVQESVSRYATHAAFNDHRFDPIGLHELTRLKVGVSVLSRFERADHVYDWDVGVHGIILEIDGGRLSATYLPEVCHEHKWSREYCIQSLAEKAGFGGTLKGRLLEQAVVTKYQSTKSEMTYHQYLQTCQ